MLQYVKYREKRKYTTSPCLRLREMLPGPVRLQPRLRCAFLPFGTVTNPIHENVIGSPQSNLLRNPTPILGSLHVAEEGVLPGGVAAE